MVFKPVECVQLMLWIDAGACVILGSGLSSPYSSPNPPSKQVTDLQLEAMLAYYCDASINYDLLPLVRNRILFSAGMKVRVCYSS